MSNGAIALGMILLMMIVALALWQVVVLRRIRGSQDAVRGALETIAKALQRTT